MEIIVGVILISKPPIIHAFSNKRTSSGQKGFTITYFIELDSQVYFRRLLLMKKRRNRTQKIWRNILNIFFNSDNDSPAFRTSLPDQRAVLCRSGVLCLCVVSLILPIEWVQHRRLINTVSAYIASATDEEYEEISWQLRHDLVYSDFGQNKENFVRYIPNTSDLCPTCSTNESAQAFLVCTNTGEFYEMDVYADGFQPDIHYGAVHMSNGYDEVSQTALSAARTPDQKRTTIELRRKRGIVSIHRMKALFCDNCIHNILTATEDATVGEFVIFDSGRKKFYPVDDEIEVRIGDYNIVTTEISGTYKITVTYVK